MKVILLSMIVLITLTAGSINSQSSSTATPLHIQADRQEYTLTMSSTVGIGLTPVYPAGIDNKTVGFNWQTDYGQFLAWNAPDFVVKDLGSNITTDDSKIYWSFLGETGTEKPIIHVRLSMIDRISGRIINHTTLDIGWKDGQIAQVLNTS